ncbi:MAG: COX15/CtaA family protein [Bacteroidota bacterium]|nr:COX15/CtaA family protein [Bacteroidota bacterium]
MYNKSLHRFAIFTAANTFALIFIGGLVTSTGSGLSVPDWPTTYGENMFTFPIDKWIGGIKYEHGHRLVASFVGFLTVILTVWLAIKEDRPWLKLLGYFALAMVIVQGILGGLTVLFLLPTAVSIAHGMLAQTFFCIVSSIALFTSRWWRSGEERFDFTKGRSLQAISILATAAVFLQLAFGALLRHTYSGLSIPDFPLAYGQIFPTLSVDAVAKYNQELISTGIKWTGDKQIEAYQIVIHLIHRYWAYGTALIVIVLGYKLWKSKELPKRLQRTGVYLLTFAILQFTLGIITVLSRKEFIVTSFHVVIGALILMTCVITTLQVARLRWLNQNTGL